MTDPRLVQEIKYAGFYTFVFFKYFCSRKCFNQSNQTTAKKVNFILQRQHSRSSQFVFVRGIPGHIRVLGPTLVRLLVTK